MEEIIAKEYLNSKLYELLDNLAEKYIKNSSDKTVYQTAYDILYQIYKAIDQMKGGRVMEIKFDLNSKIVVKLVRNSEKKKYAEYMDKYNAARKSFGLEPIDYEDQDIIEMSLLKAILIFGDKNEVTTNETGFMP